MPTGYEVDTYRNIARAAQALEKLVPAVEAIAEAYQPTPSPEHTPNGYDLKWVEAINGALADRAASVRMTDLDHALWARTFGPLLDEIEAAVENGLMREITTREETG